MLCFKFQQNRTINEHFDFFEGRGRGGADLNLNYYWYAYEIVGFHMKMFCFKFQQNRTINEEFDFWRGGQRDPHIYILISIIIGTHMKLLGRTINEKKIEGGRQVVPIYKF